MSTQSGTYFSRMLTSQGNFSIPAVIWLSRRKEARPHVRQAAPLHLQPAKSTLKLKLCKLVPVSYPSPWT
jgi:hypothetical protein